MIKFLSKIKYLISLLLILLTFSGASCSAETLQDLLAFPGGDPLKANMRQIPFILNNVINVLTAISGTTALIFFIIGGYYYIFSFGNEEMASKGKNALLYSSIGLIIIISAYVIVKYIITLTVNNASNFVK